MNEHYTNYEEPIEEMKRLSSRNIPFQFSFKKEDGTTRTIRKAKLRKGSKKAKYSIQFEDLITGECRSFSIPLLLSFNNKLIKFSK